MRVIVLERPVPEGGFGTTGTTGAAGAAMLVDAAQARGLDARIVEAARADDPSLATIVAAGSADEATSDVVLARVGARTDDDLERITGMLWSLEHRGIRCVPSAEGLVASADRLRTFVRMRRAEVPMPSTVAMFVSAQRAADVALLHEQLRAFPVVLKRPVGRGRVTTVRCDDGPSLRAAMEREQAERPDGAVLIQPFWPHERVVTVRVAAGTALSARVRQAGAVGEGTGPVAGDEIRREDLNANVSRVAVAAVAACALRSGTVDLLENAAGLRTVIRVDAVPSLLQDVAADREFAAAIVAAAVGGA